MLKKLNNKKTINESIRFITYCIIGLLITSIVYFLWNLGLLLLEKYVIITDVVISLVQFVASFIGIGVSLILNRFVTFRNDSRAHSSVLITIALFFGVYSITIAISSLSTYALLVIFDSQYLFFIQIFTLLINVALNYIAQRFVIFRVLDSIPESKSESHSTFSSDIDTFDYEGRDLEVMSAAKNYNDWIISNCTSYFGNKIVEVGAGAGSFASAIMDSNPDSQFTLIEPSNNMFALLKTTFENNNNVSVINGFTFDLNKKIKNNSYDSYVYSNVLEHVEDDVKEMQLAYSKLKLGGHIITFSPALPFLLSDFDKSIGHYRRYTLNEMIHKMEEAGFEVVKAQYFDMFGIIPWFINFKVLKTKTMNPQAIKTYDTYFVPVLRLLESILTPFVGKNILVIGKK